MKKPSVFQVSVCATTVMVACGGVPADAVATAPIGQLAQKEVLACPVGLSGFVFDKESLITSLGVVNDPCRTNLEAMTGPTCTASQRGKWSFGFLISQAAGKNNVSEFALRMLESFATNQSINGFTVLARPRVWRVINAWRKASGCASDKKYDEDHCTLNMAKAPFRLLAIVNRMDLRPSGGSISGYGGPLDGAGEGRILFGALDDTGAELQATMIFEYNLPTARLPALSWASAWHSLSSIAAASYNGQLQAITDLFTLKGAVSGGDNQGTALLRIRSDERAFDSNTVYADSQWELRELPLQCTPGVVPCDKDKKLLLPAPTALTPDKKFAKDSLFGTFIDNNAMNIINGTYTVPATFGGMAFLGGSSLSQSIGEGQAVLWGRNVSFTSAPEIAAKARRSFAFNTCSGCHYTETNTANFHVFPRTAAQKSNVSNFLQAGADLMFPDPITGDNVSYNEPSRRLCEQAWLLGGHATTLSITTGRTH